MPETSVAFLSAHHMAVPMGSSRKKLGWAEVLGYIIGGLMLLPAVLNSSLGAPLYQVAGLAAGGLITIAGSLTFLGNRRVLPLGIFRDGDSVVCRYIPWFEMNAYIMFVVVPIVGISAVAAGSIPGKPGWLRFFGLLILGIVVLAGYFVVQMWRRCLVTFGRSSVTVRLPARGSGFTEVSRPQVLSITSADAEVGAAFAPATVKQVALTYQSADQSSDTRTVLIGPPAGKTALQVSVAPTAVYNALLAWKDADPNDPRLMDRIEAILRGKEPASV